MKSFIVFALIVAAAAAAPQTNYEKDAQVLKYENDNIGVDSFSNAYETSNGISAQQQGQLVNPGAENEAVVQRGQYSYTGPDGVLYTVEWTADENGFQARGAHLPSL